MTEPHVAIGTGALAVSVNAFAKLRKPAIKGHVWWRCAVVFSALGVLGALGGSSLGKAMDGDRLIFVFGILMVVVGVLMLKPKKPVSIECRPVDLRMCLSTAAVALFAGAASGFFGIGGGS
ncbi:TSUP family transporter (plasmid) [Sinorhizobium meliloti]|nr:TSUP family transporter [Sinorhizobium meliloti]